jgi:hypothetical protein
MRRRVPPKHWAICGVYVRLLRRSEVSVRKVKACANEHDGNKTGAVMSMIDAIEAAAKEATPKWKDWDEWYHDHSVGVQISEEDAVFIGKCSPANILKLVAAYREMEKGLKWLESHEDPDGDYARQSLARAREIVGVEG